MDASLHGHPYLELQGADSAEASVRPLSSSPLRVSVGFENGEIKTLERFLTARTRFETPDAERAELYKIFRRFDKDGDGKLSVEEIRVSLEELSVIVSDAELASLLCAEPGGDLYRDNGYDEDANEQLEDMRKQALEYVGPVKDESKHIGYVDFTEFCQLYRSLCQEENEEGVICTPNGRLVEADLRYAFDMFDKNRDTFISVRELQSVLMSLGFKEAKSLDECKSMVAAVDSDGDGMVNFDEFKAMMRSIKEDQ